MYPSQSKSADRSTLQTTLGAAAALQSSGAKPPADVANPPPAPPQPPELPAHLQAFSPKPQSHPRFADRWHKTECPAHPTSAPYPKYLNVASPAPHPAANARSLPGSD